MSNDAEKSPKFKSTDVIRNEDGRPIAPQPAKNFDTMAEQSDEPKEIGGRKNGSNPTRFGDWEKDGRCVDF